MSTAAAVETRNVRPIALWQSQEGVRRPEQLVHERADKRSIWAAKRSVSR